MREYQVLVDDNYHYMDPDERYTYGIYETPEEALAVCRQIVDQCLREGYEPGMSADALYSHYTSFGDDPFIVVPGGGGEDVKFSAWDYAKERCRVICGEVESDEALKPKPAE
jgi:hypothetical protein